MPLPRLVGKFVGTEIANRRSARRFVFRVCLLAVVVAVGFDVAQQLAFFTDWQTALRSWSLSALVAVAIALPVAVAMARAYLALYQAKEEVLELSRRDPLTGLLNRRALLQSGAQMQFMALVIVDIDRFKRINDTHGHLVGDEVIHAVGQLMTERLGDLGPVGRLGGEEFALLSLDPSADALIDRLWEFRDLVASMPIVVDETVVTVTISAGVARRDAGQSLHDLYRAADRALYLAKAAGRNTIIVDEDLASGIASRREPARSTERRELRARQI